MKKETYKDTDLREALRRKYSDTPQLPADFLTKMEERMAQEDEPTVPESTTRKRLWRWVAAAACLRLIIGLGITMLSKEQAGQTEDLYAHAHKAQKTDKSPDHQQQVSIAQAIEEQETVPQPSATAKANDPKPHVAKADASEKPSPSAKSPATTLRTKDGSIGVKSHNDDGFSESSPVFGEAPSDNLHYANNTTESPADQAPSRMDEFIAKIADYNKVTAVPLECISGKEDSNIDNKAYVFRDTKELDLFSRLFQAACWYDSKSPGYMLNFSQQQFFFTLKDLHKEEKYLWIAERIDGGRILLYTSHSPIEANVSSACYQKYREQLMHTFGTSKF